MSEWIDNYRVIWEFAFQLLTAVGTVGAVIVALWIALRQEWRERRTRPILHIGIRLCPPDCTLDRQREIVRFPRQGSGFPRQFIETETEVDAYWFRMYVHNSGNTAAREVEVTISDVTEKRQGNWVPYSAFLLSNLVWTHYQREALGQLLPGTDRHFDVGNVRQPSPQQKELSVPISAQHRAALGL